MMPETDADDDTELVDRYDGASINRDHIQGTFEYTVELTDEQVDDLPDQIDAAEFAGNIAQSRANAELDASFRIDRSDVLVEEESRFFDEDGRQFTAYVRFSQND